MLLILAVVAIRAVTGDGILQYAKKSTNDYTKAQEKEEIMLALDEWRLAKHTVQGVKFDEFMADRIEGATVTANEDGSVTIVFKETSYNVTEVGTITEIAKEGGDEGEEPEEPEEENIHLCTYPDDGDVCTECGCKYYAFSPSDYDKKMGTTFKTDSVVEVPETFEYNGIKYRTKRINSFAFMDNAYLKSIVIPNSVTDICYYAFGGCTSLESIIIPDSVTYMAEDSGSNGANVFKNCTSLKSVTIGNGVTNIFDYTFSGCTALESVTIGDNVTTIGRCAFYNCSSIESVTIPDSVTSLEWQAFARCNSLESITIPNSVTTIGEGAFSYCSLLESVNFGNNVTTIGPVAFADCRSLTNIVIPDSVVSIGDEAFWSCTSLTSIIIPDNVKTIGQGAFDYCNSLKSIAVNDNNSCFTSIDGVLFNKDKTILITYPYGKTIASYIVPDGVTTIENYAFNDCDIESITLPESLTTIENYAFFSNNSLISIIIPDSVKSIGEGAFCYCNQLESVTIGNSVTTIGVEAFSDCYSLTDVYYTGAEAEWNNIIIGDNNSCLTSATIHFNS